MQNSIVRNIKLSQICDIFSLKYFGDDVTIDGLNLCNRESQFASILSYVTDENYLNYIKDKENISCIVLSKQLFQKCILDNKYYNYLSCIISDEAEGTFYDIHEYLVGIGFYEKYEFESTVGTSCNIADSVIIEDGVVIGNNVSIGHNTVVRKGTRIEDNVNIGCNNTIGSEGFQVLKIDGENRRITHAGGLLIKEGVSIGDNNTICNSLFEGETYIGKNVMVDNLCYIGHNGYIGEGAIITAGNIFCGSSRIESNAWVGVNSSVLNRVVIGEGVRIGMGSVVTRDISPNCLAYGVPARVK